MTTETEQAILQMRAAGAGYRTISRETGISTGTIAKYLQSVESNGKIHTCLQCGKTIRIVPKRKKKKYCSDKCRMLWWNSHKDAVNRRTFYTIRCAFCGKKFQSYGNAGRKYCSRECYVDSERKRNE